MNGNTGGFGYGGECIVHLREMVGEEEVICMGDVKAV